MAEETNNPKQANEVPSTVEQQAPSVAEDNATSTSEPEATDIPTANAPDPDENLVENPEAAREKGTSVIDTPNESDLQAKAAEKPGAKKAAASPKREGTADKASDEATDELASAKPAAKKAAPPKGDKPAAAAKAKEDKPAAAKAAKKEKPPAVEDKPFTEFMQQDYLPALQNAFTEKGLQGIDVTFKKQNIPVVGYEQDECWQVIGHWQNAPRQFNIYFPEEDIGGAKFFSCNEGSRPSTLEHFLGDERKITLDLMIYGVIQRLNGQKWLARN